MPQRLPYDHENKAHVDITKTRAYAIVDLSARVLSAITLVALGIAGWLLQHRTEEARQLANEREQPGTRVSAGVT